MIVFLVCLFGDYFPGINPSKSFFNIQTRIYETNSGDYYVSGCKLTGFSNSAIFFSISASIRLLIENCFISESRPSGNIGGGVYFDCSLGDIVLSRSCGYKCSASECQFGLFRVGTGKTIKLVDNSVSDSYLVTGYATLYTNDPIQVRKGNQLAQNCNFSRNSGLCASGFQTFDSDSCSIQYCTIAKNHAYDSMCVRFEYGPITLQNSNIVGNSNTKSSWGLIHHHGGTSTTSNCCIQDNTCSSGTLIIFYFYTGSASISSCWIQSSGTLNGVTHQSPIVLFSTYQFTHIPLHLCQYGTPLKSPRLSTKNLSYFAVFSLIIFYDF